MWTAHWKNVYFLYLCSCPLTTTLNVHLFQQTDLFYTATVICFTASNAKNKLNHLMHETLNPNKEK